MRVISLIYKYNQIDLSVQISFYFRMIGVYVTEKFYEPRVSVTNEIEQLWPKIKGVNPYNGFYDYDVEIYLINNIDEYSYYLRNQSDKTIAIIGKDVEVEEELNYIYEKKISRNRILDEILWKMLSLNFLSTQEYDDYADCLKIYQNQEYLKNIFISKYFYKDEIVFNKRNASFDDIICSLKGEWDPWNRERKCYVLLSLMHDDYVYKKRNNVKSDQNIYEIIALAYDLEDKCSEKLKSAVWLLLGEIYDDIKNEKNRAYDYYMRSCTKKESYNAYVFFQKGKYWQYFVGNFENAQRYYFKSILIYPEYYRAWYKLGFCFYKTGDLDEAFLCFNSLRKILYSRLANRNMKPLEIEYYFLACEHCGDILYYRYADVEKAIEYYKYASDAWESIPFTNFWRYIVGADGNFKEEIDVVNRNIDIQSINEKLSKLRYLV